MSLLLCLCLLGSSLPVQARPTDWMQLQGPVGKNDLNLAAVCESSGVVFFAGHSGSRGKQGMFVSRAGEGAWVKQLGQGRIAAMAPDGQGGVVVSGSRFPPKALVPKTFIARYDARGRQLWFVQPETEVTGDLAVLRVDNSRILAAGVHNTKKPGESNGWLLQLSMQGKILADARPGRGSYHYLLALARVDGGWLAGGAVKQAGTYNDWLLAFSDAGQVSEIFEQASPSFDGLQAACEDGQGGAYFLGLSAPAQGTLRNVGQISVTRVNAKGEIQWRRMVGNSMSGAFAPRVEGGRLVFVAPEIEPAKGTGRLQLVSLDGQGTTERLRKIPAPAVMLNYTTPGAFLLGSDSKGARLILVDKSSSGGLRWRWLLLPWY